MWSFPYCRLCPLTVQTGSCNTQTSPGLFSARWEVFCLPLEYFLQGQQGVCLAELACEGRFCTIYSSFTTLPITLCMYTAGASAALFIADSEYKHHPGQGPDPRKTVFIGGVPRPMRACELADIMNKRFGHVSYAAIVLDTDVNYPKGD